MRKSAGRQPDPESELILVKNLKVKILLDSVFMNCVLYTTVHLQYIAILFLACNGMFHLF